MFIDGIHTTPIEDRAIQKAKSMLDSLAPRSSMSVGYLRDELANTYPTISRDRCTAIAQEVIRTYPRGSLCIMKVR